MSATTLAVRVRYFASLRERFGRGEDSLELEPGSTVRDAWRRATGEHELPANVRAARNLDYVEAGAALADGDELAFFPPVTGG